MFDRKLIQNFDWGLLSLTFTLAIIGLATLYSAVTSDVTGQQKVLYIKQLVWYSGGLVIMIATITVNYKSFDRWAYVIYGGCVVLLILVLIAGKVGGGSRRWISLGPVSLQPSELVKIAVIICLARYYSKFARTKGLSLSDLTTPCMLTVVPFILIVKQPDLGTGLLVVLIAASMTLFIKIERKTMAFLIVVASTTVPMIWFVLKDYQKQRILTFLDPDRDPLGAGYHIIQSKISIGSGMIYGKGYLKGTQTALAFLPEQHTDFIFSVLSEEWGFIGSMLVLLLFLLLILWGLNIAYGCRDPFGTVLAVGITAMIAWQVFINIGMVMGLMPVVGVTLPFISYGGSSTIATMTSVGVLLNISMRRYMYE